MTNDISFPGGIIDREKQVAAAIAGTKLTRRQHNPTTAKAPADYSFRPAKGSHAMRKDVAEAIGAATFPGVKSIAADPRATDVVYITCDRSAWFRLLALATRHSGNERKGDRRQALFTRPG